MRGCAGLEVPGVTCVQMAGAGPMILICEDQESEGARACPQYAPDQAPGQGLSQ
jgi:hypothetical protein